MGLPAGIATMRMRRNEAAASSGEWRPDMRVTALFSMPASATA